MYLHNERPHKFHNDSIRPKIRTRNQKWEVEKDRISSIQIHLVDIPGIKNIFFNYIPPSDC